MLVYLLSTLLHSWVSIEYGVCVCVCVYLSVLTECAHQANRTGDINGNFPLVSWGRPLQHAIGSLQCTEERKRFFFFHLRKKTSKKSEKIAFGAVGTGPRRLNLKFDVSLLHLSPLFLPFAKCRVTFRSPPN